MNIENWNTVYGDIIPINLGAGPESREARSQLKF